MDIRLRLLRPCHINPKNRDGGQQCTQKRLKIPSIHLLCRPGVARELNRTLFGLTGGVQLIVFLPRIKNSLERKIYGRHKQKCYLMKVKRLREGRAGKTAEL
jgi:hypothetical protein